LKIDAGLRVSGAHAGKIAGLPGVTAFRSHLLGVAAFLF